MRKMWIFIFNHNCYSMYKTGRPGLVGFQGSRGRPGPRGLKGVMGRTGLAGLKGFAGKNIYNRHEAISFRIDSSYFSTNYSVAILLKIENNQVMQHLIDASILSQIHNCVKIFLKDTFFLVLIGSELTSKK